MTAIGTRRPREGRCERCDRPLTGEVYDYFEAYGADGREVRATDPEWLALTPTRDGECEGDKHVCRGPSVDWRTRALAAEAALADAEERGRLTGLFEAWCAVAAERDAEMECYRRSRGQDGGEYWKGVVDTTDEALTRIVTLAKEATDGR